MKMMIDGMTAQQIEDAIWKSWPTSDTIYTSRAAIASAVHRLANTPAPVVGADVIQHAIDAEQECRTCHYRTQQRCARFPSPQPPVNLDDWCGEWREVAKVKP